MWKQQKIMSAYITVTVMTDSIERFLYYERGFFSAKGHLPEDKDNGAD